jgi:hypothetical protein
MPKGDKYVSLTSFLLHCGQETIQMAFSKIDELCGLSPYAYKYSAAWNNVSQHSLSFGWLLADYVVEDYSLLENWVIFRHDPLQAKDYLARMPNHK